jgi:hypothetical protein
LISCLTGLDKSVLQIKTKNVNCHTTDSKPVKQGVNGTVTLPPLVFPAYSQRGNAKCRSKYVCGQALRHFPPVGVVPRLGDDLAIGAGQRIKVDLMSISPVFYEQLFCVKVFCAPFMYLQFGFVIFWRNDFGAKAAHKMLVKLTPCVGDFRSRFQARPTSICRRRSSSGSRVPGSVPSNLTPML